MITGGYDSGQRRATIEFCKCTHDAVRLLYLGYLAGSPVQPQTAFSIPLLTFHNHLWNNCHIGALPFTTALTQFLEPRSQRLFARKHNRQNVGLFCGFLAPVDGALLMSCNIFLYSSSHVISVNHLALQWTCIGVLKKNQIH
jgi:hypothetical protein